MAEHIRIALLDPKWKEKSGHLKPGEKEQTLAEHDEVCPTALPVTSPVT
jgi:hypothetical protein